MAKRWTAKEKKRFKKSSKVRAEVLVPPEIVQELSMSGGIPVVEPPGELRMSEVILRFAEPLLKQSDSDEYFRKVVPLAIVAWNASFLPPEKQEEMIQDIFRLLDVHDNSAQVLQGELRNLIDWRLREFSDINRLIVNYKITFSDLGPQLFVASTLNVSLAALAARLGS
jgi:hypothetical protein